MDFWNDNTTLVTQKKWKLWNQSSVKIKNKESSNEELISEVHSNFSYIYIYYFKKI
jgi:hypothetical protein